MSIKSVAYLTRRHNLIIQRLSEVGIPHDNLNQIGLVAFVKNNKSYLPQLVNAILPKDNDDVVDGNNEFHEIMIWLQWLMFEDEPQQSLGQLSNHKRSVCGFIFTGNNDIVYHCLTCDRSPISASTAICVSCFHNGSHQGHEFSVIDSVDGCCDCGDITALRREGFCSNHKGIDHMQPLPDHVVSSFGPVLDILLSYWKNKLLLSKVAHELTSTLVAMLLDFCQCSESLLSFIAGKVCSSPGLLEILLKAETVMNENVGVKLHELFLTLFVEPTFKYEFAKAFIVYYTSVVSLAISEGGDAAFKKHPLLSIFTVQIFSVPILTTRLVEEIDLVGVLFQCLGNIISFCAGEDGRLQVDKWISVYETTFRVVGDIGFVMTHSGVPKYICHCRRELVTTWIKLLAFAQGMDSQKRETVSHVNDGNENVHMPFFFFYSISYIFSLLVAGAFSASSNEDSKDKSSFISHKIECDYEDIPRHSEVGRLMQESSIGIVAGKGVLSKERKASDTLPIPTSAFWLTHECLQSMQYWLKMDNTVGDLNELESLSVLSVSQWPNISYDVSSQEISINIPLHRGLALVIFRSMREWCDKSEPSYLPRSISADRSLRRHDGDFFGQILDGCQPYGFSAYVMEHPLRIRVFCAQVNAGMWKMNGKAPTLISEAYRYMGRSELGQGLDLFLLQCCAALAPPDFYIQRILERFGLSNYLSLNLEEQHTAHEPILLAEMLTLLVQIVKERMYCGLTTAESLQRELILILSVRNTTRGQLVKSLLGDRSKISQLQEVLDAVAERSHLSDMTQESRYELRSSYWKEFDLYHPRWNSRDRKVAGRRYMRFSNVSAFTTQLPRWTNIYHPLKRIAKIATCKTLLQVIRSVLYYAVSTTSRVPDEVLVTTLHLLSLTLDVCRVHMESDDLACYVDDVIQVLAFTREEIFTTSNNGKHNMWSLLILLKTVCRHRNLDESLVGPRSLNILILNITNSFVRIETELTRLHKENPRLLADKCLPEGQPFLELFVCNQRSGDVLVEKMKSMKLNEANEDDAKDNLKLSNANEDDAKYNLNLSSIHLDPKTSSHSAESSQTKELLF